MAKVYRKRRAAKGKGKKRVAGRRRRGGKSTAPMNTACIRENYTTTINDGTMNFFRNIQLADLVYDRAQAVANAFQEFCIKSVKLRFQPAADTFTPASGNTIPQIYFMVDKSNAVPTNVTLNNLLDMGVKPVRFDNYNITRSWKPTVLTADMTNPAAVVASQPRTSPWLSTNANSGNPGAAWLPSAVDHQGALAFITRLNPATPVTPIHVDVEVVFAFRKPLWTNRVGEPVPAAIIRDGAAQPL